MLEDRKQWLEIILKAEIKISEETLRQYMIVQHHMTISLISFPLLSCVLFIFILHDKVLLNGLSHFRRQ